MGIFHGDSSSTVVGGGGGIHFKDPWEFVPIMAIVGHLHVYDSGRTLRTSATTNFFTEMARRGLQDTTDWTQNTYKTLLNVAGKGLVGAIIGCTAGGTETTTFEITVDGVLNEIAVGTLASGERACLLAGYSESTEYTATDNFQQPVAETLEADKATFGALSNVAATCVLPWRSLRGVPLLKFNSSLLIRAKHSVNITNSTATAYSAVQYRLGL